MGVQGGCERRSKVFVKIQNKKKNLRGGGLVGIGGSGGGGSDQAGVGVGEVEVARFGVGG